MEGRAYLDIHQLSQLVKRCRHSLSALQLSFAVVRVSPNAVVAESAGFTLIGHPRYEPHQVALPRVGAVCRLCSLRNPSEGDRMDQKEKTCYDPTCTTILDLPTEILITVFEQCLTKHHSVPLRHRRPTLSQCDEIYQIPRHATKLTRVCRRFHEVGTILLFEALAWGRRESEFSVLVEHFRHFPKHGALVQRFYCDKNSDYHWGSRAQTEQLFPPFNLLVNLRYLALGGELCLPNLIWIRKHGAVFPRLEKLVIDQSGHTISLEALLPLLLLPRLENVRLFCCNIDVSASLSATEAIDEQLDRFGSSLLSPSKLPPLQSLWCISCSFYEPETAANWIKAIRGTRGLVMRCFHAQRDDGMRFMNELAPTLQELEYNCSAYTSPNIPPDLSHFSMLTVIRIEALSLVDVPVSNRHSRRYVTVHDAGPPYPVYSGASPNTPAQLPATIEELYIEILAWKVHRGRFYEYLHLLLDIDGDPLQRLRRLTLALKDGPPETYQHLPTDVYSWSHNLIAGVELLSGNSPRNAASFSQRRAVLSSASENTSEHCQLEKACEAANVRLEVRFVRNGEEESMDPAYENI